VHDRILKHYTQFSEPIEYSGGTGELDLMCI